MEKTHNLKTVNIHTDGSCLGNPGPGGWAAVLQMPDSGVHKELSGGFARTTNNRMEILAVIEGLKALKEACAVDLYSDSQYVCNAVEKRWLASWRKNNWIKSDKKPVKNRDLWEAMIPLLERHKVRFIWLRGHSGHTLNERCDVLARNEAGRRDLPQDTGMTE